MKNLILIAMVLLGWSREAWASVYSTVPSAPAGAVAGVSPGTNIVASTNSGAVTISVADPATLRTLSVGSLTATNPVLYNTLQLNLSTVSASALLGTDSGKNVASYTAGNGITVSGGSVAISSTPAINLANGTNLPPSGITYGTNANGSTTLTNRQYALLVTNNNVALASGFLAGSVSATEPNWAVLIITNTTASAKTLTTPASLQMAGLAVGAQTFYITNWAVLSVLSYGYMVTGGVFKGFP